MFTTTFWKATVERAIKTFAQGAAALLTADAVGLLQVDWAAIGSVSGLAALISILTSVGSAPFGPANSPSLTGDE